MNVNGKVIEPASDGKLRIAVSPRALFDMSREDELFASDGIDTYRSYQLGHLDQPYGKGVAYNFIERILNFNAIGDDTGTKGHGSLVEVIVMSHMDPSTGVRVMRTIKHYGLDVYQSVFSSGSSLTPFIASMGVSLYLSTDEDSVREALDAGFPAGRVMGPITAHDDPNGEVRIAFDFDGVLADDSSENRFATEGLAGFCDHEYRHAFEPMKPGPLLPFLKSLGHLQKTELAYKANHPDYRRRLKIAICTARGMPSDVRVIKSLEHWGINVDIACFRDGCDKAPFLRGFDASLFFDDQLRHIDAAEQYVPSVHVPFGVKNVEATNCGNVVDSNACNCHDDAGNESNDAAVIINDTISSSDGDSNGQDADNRNVIIDLTGNSKCYDDNVVVLPNGNKPEIDMNEHSDSHQFESNAFVPRNNADGSNSGFEITSGSESDIDSDANSIIDTIADSESDKPDDKQNDDEKSGESGTRKERYELILSRLMSMPWIDPIKTPDKVGGIYFKRPQDDGTWGIGLNSSSASFGLFFPACRCNQTQHPLLGTLDSIPSDSSFGTFVLETRNDKDVKIYHSIVNGYVDCVSTSGLGHVILDDIDNRLWRRSYTVRTLVMQFNNYGDYSRARAIASDSIKPICNEFPSLHINLRSDDGHSQSGSVLALFMLRIAFSNPSDGECSYETWSYATKRLTEATSMMADCFTSTIESARIIARNLEIETAYRIANAVISFDAIKMREDKALEILNKNDSNNSSNNNSNVKGR